MKDMKENESGDQEVENIENFYASHVDISMMKSYEMKMVD